MSLRDQMTAVNKSAVANAIGLAFLIAFGVTAAERVIGAEFDIVTVILNFGNRDWLLQFLRESFNHAFYAALGVCQSNLFPVKPSSPQFVNTQP